MSIKNLSDIENTYTSIIDTHLSQKASFDSTFKDKMSLIKKEINDTSLKYLDVSKRVDMLLDHIISMMINNTMIIKHYGEYVNSIFENIQSNEAELLERETHIQELEQQLEAVSERARRLEFENDVLSDKLKASVPQSGQTQTQLAIDKSPNIKLFSPEDPDTFGMAKEQPENNVEEQTDESEVDESDDETEYEEQVEEQVETTSPKEKSIKKRRYKKKRTKKAGRLDTIKLRPYVLEYNRRMDAGEIVDKAAYFIEKFGSDSQYIYGKFRQAQAEYQKELELRKGESD